MTQLPVHPASRLACLHFGRLRSLRSLVAFCGLLLAASCSQDAGVAAVLVVSTVEVTPPSGTVVLGQTLQLIATPKTEGGIPLPARDVIWTSTDNATAGVSSDGMVTGHSIGGPVGIRATVEGVTGETQITVLPVPVDHVIVTPPQNGILVGQAAQLTATAYDSTGAVLSGRTFFWFSGASSVVAITTTGLVLGMSQGGPVTITANAEGKAGGATVTVSRRPAARLGVGQQPGQAIAGIALTPAVKVLVQDDLLGTVTDAANPVTIALAGNPTGATLSGTRTVTAVNGVATFANLVIDRAGTGYTLVAGAPGLTAAISTPFTVVAGAANKLALSTAPPANARSGVEFGTHPVVQIRDGSNNPVSQSGVPITASIASGNGTLGGTVTVATNASGAANFANLSIAGSVGTFTISFNVPGIAPVTSGTITLTAGLPATVDIVTQPSATAQSGVVLARQPVVRLLDGQGNPVLQGGVVVTASIASGPAGGTLGGSAVASTSGSGLAAFSGLVLTGPEGSYVLGFTSGALPAASSAPVLLAAGAGASLSLTAQPSPQVVGSVPFPQQPVVQLRDASGNPVAQAGILVAASIQVGGGQLIGGTTASTDASGTATFTDLAINGSLGARTLLLASAGYVSVVSNTVTVGAGAAARLVVSGQPSASAQSGVPFTRQPVLQVEDAPGNPVSQAGTSITASLASGPTGGSLGGTLVTITAPNGAASFANLSVSGPAGAYTIGFAATGLTGASSNPVTLGAGAGIALALPVPPSSAAVNGVGFPQQPVIQIVDGSGNSVSQAGVTVSVVLSTGGTLGGAATVNTDASGRAAFAGLSITGKAGNYTLGFSAPSLAGISSGTIALAPGPVTLLTITTQPSSAATNGVPFGFQPVVQALDVSGNAVGGVLVTAAITSGGGSLGGTMTATTDVSGSAAFAGLAITGLTGAHTLGFSTASAPQAVSGQIMLSAGPASQLIIATQPPSIAQSGALLSSQPVIQVADVSGNPVNSVVVAAAITVGGGTLGGTNTATSNASGMAAFTNLSMSGTIGTYTLGFSASGTTPVTSSQITLTAGVPSQIKIAQQPSGSAHRGTPFSQQPIVQVLDAAGNAVAGANVVAAINSAMFGNGKLNGTLTIVTDAAGLATFTDLEISKSGLYTLKFTSGGVRSAPSSNISVN